LLWANSTLGLTCSWWNANRQQAGRGEITLTAIPRLSIFDFGTLTSGQLQRAAAIFDGFINKNLLPFNEIDYDSIRHELDREFLFRILEVPEAVFAPLNLFRQKLAMEPSISGGKKRR
jgi:hypothetical protein